MMKRALLFLTLLLFGFAQAHEVTVCDQDESPVFSICYPSDWQQSILGSALTAVSPAKDAWSQIEFMKEAREPEDCLSIYRGDADELFENVEFDAAEEDDTGLRIQSGGGTFEGENVSFCMLAVKAPGDGCIGMVFVVEKNLEELYLETLREICSTFRLVQETGEEE